MHQEFISVALTKLLYCIMIERFVVRGGSPISGEIRISGAKNAALPIMAGCILSEGNITLRNMPNLRDIHSMSKLLSDLGAAVEFHIQEDSLDHSMTINCSNCGGDNLEAKYDLVKTMRASVLVLGPLLARFGYAKVALPGGCAIGSRPVDMHITALEALGAKIDIEHGYIVAHAPQGGLVGGKIIFDKISVGATENALLAATLAKGITTIINAALEPEIEDLCNFLNAMGAKVSGIGSSTLTIEGVEKLDQPFDYHLISDRIETGTYAIAVGITGGKLRINNCNPHHIEAVLDFLKRVGLHIEEGKDFLIVEKPKARLKAVNFETAPYPSYPTDLQAQGMALLAICDGNSIVTETIFENRFMHVQELSRMGAKITLDGRHAIIEGIERYQSADVMATDLRASVSLVLAALNADGESTIDRIYHLDRGYEQADKKLNQVGCSIKREYPMSEAV